MDLRHNPNYLRRLLTEAIRLHRPGSLEEATMLADIRDYFLYLTMDGIGDEALARSLILTFTKLEAWLCRIPRDMRDQTGDPAGPIFYSAFLFALEQLLSLRHEIPMLPGEKISREDFRESWKGTAHKLGLS